MSSITNSPGSFFNRSLSQMADLRAGIERTRSQIATGRRIERGSQDPAAAAQLRSVARREALAKVEGDNAARLGQDLGAASNELEAVTVLLQRARELALAAANTPTGSQGRQAIVFELGQLQEQLFSRANAASLTGEPLFAGQSSAQAFTRDAAGNVTYAGTATSGAVPIAPGTTIERGLPGSEVFEFSLGGSPSSAFAVLGALTSALQGGAADPAAAANASLEGLDTALETINRAQTILGTRMAWVEQVQDQQGERGIALAEQRSRVGDTDVADAVARLQQSLTALEATQAAFARVSSLTLFDALRR
ncbi:flagellar biosynthesis protein FlgL [Erythrobacter sp. NE805]|uniref:flagellin N-terminal helical domain-containing protein n=1 Tax=Erythrobacter sp. NE805 TaxID=3389875 RepID=UPI00396B1897